MLQQATAAGKRRDIVLTLAFFVVCLTLMLRHEMWRDEMHHWKIVTDNPSPAAILKTVNYEGHPFLWHALLFPFSRISQSPFIMQAVHLLIATLAAFLFLRHARFPLLALLLALSANTSVYALILVIALALGMLADVCILIPVANPERVTAHAESFQSVIWHLLVSHPELQTAPTKWESMI